MRAMDFRRLVLESDACDQRAWETSLNINVNLKERTR